MRYRVIAFLVLVLTMYAAFTGIGPVPPLGPLLDPVSGILASARYAELPSNAQGEIPQMKGPVNVIYDDRAVPHIFASNTEDAYRALGYVVARDRLFQIEMATRAGGGTLTELVGDVALPLDRSTRALGMPRSAEQRVANIDTTTATWRMISAYAQGVNAWIESLSKKNYPIEYKLLGREPRKYSMVDMMHMYNRMGYTLASSEDELKHLRASAIIGKDAAEALFPIHSPIVEPIQPNGQRAPRKDSVTIPPPGSPDPIALSLSKYIQDNTGTGVPKRGPDAVGSNNWAVAPSRSANGYALLAGDPHLELTLPSIWYEAHISIADSVDVYGVTIPGLPGIVIGFNRDVAWTFTNVGADVMDYYLEQVDDTLNPVRYLLDGEWQTIERRIEKYLTPSGNLIHEDTLRYTHRGPLRKIDSRWISHRWTVLESSAREMEVFDLAARSKSARELLDHMTEYFETPAQNMLAADRNGAIAIRSTGRYPIRPDSGRGDILRDGSKTSSDWIGNWSIAEYPQSFSPSQGFIASANQEPIDGKQQPRYLGADWERPWRAIRINELLRNNSQVTAEDMRIWQTEAGSARAEMFVPFFLQAVRNGSPRTSLVRAGQHLSSWNRRYTTDNIHAVLFEEAMTNLSRLLYDELYEKRSESNTPIPSDMITAVLLNDPQNVWWDNKSTQSIESRDNILADALEEAWEKLTQQIGEVDSSSWAWSKHRTASIQHMLRIPSFSRTNIPVQGGNGMLNPSSGSGTHGASWRMVVELDKEVRARVIYPGGQSGHPASSRYDDRLNKWTKGELESAIFPESEHDLPSTKIISRLELTRKAEARR